MNKQTLPMDWEAAMKATEANAGIAAELAERMAGRMVEMLDDLRHHGQQLSRMEKMMKEMATKASAHPPLPHRSLPPLPARRFPPLPLITAAFLLGAAFGGFIASW
jgi:hypothetical protein